jgi:hypothetical protein
MMAGCQSPSPSLGSGLPKLELSSFERASRNCDNVFRWYHAAAKPPVKTDAAATAVTLSHLERGGGKADESAEVVE